MHANFKATGIFVFGCAMVKTGKCGDVTFLNEFLAFPIVVHQNK